MDYWTQNDTTWTYVRVADNNNPVFRHNGTIESVQVFDRITRSWTALTENNVPFQFDKGIEELKNRIISIAD